MVLNRNRVIAKSRTQQHTRKRPDFLAALPPDITASILDTLREDDLHRIPLVSKTWASLFSHGSPVEPSLRHFVHRRFGLTDLPPQSGHLSWGQLYLALRRERCHLCPASDVAPCVYAGSSSLSVMLECGLSNGDIGLALFPVCNRCFNGLLKARRDAFVPVVEKAAVNFVFPGIKEGPVEGGMGFLYSDIPNAVRCDRGVEYVFARPLAQLSELRRKNDVRPNAGGFQ